MIRKISAMLVSLALALTIFPMSGVALAVDDTAHEHAVTTDDFVVHKINDNMAVAYAAEGVDISALTSDQINAIDGESHAHNVQRNNLNAAQVYCSTHKYVLKSSAYVIHSEMGHRGTHFETVYECSVCAYLYKFYTCFSSCPAY